MAPFPFQFGHEFEIHSIDSDQEGQRDENSRKDGQYLHDLVHAITHAGQVNIKHTIDDFPQGLHGIYDLNSVVVEHPANKSWSHP